MDLLINLYLPLLYILLQSVKYDFARKMHSDDLRIYVKELACDTIYCTHT